VKGKPIYPGLSHGRQEAGENDDPVGRLPCRTSKARERQLAGLFGAD